VQAGEESEWNYELATTYYFYTANPRLVQGVTCADWANMPGLDPNPPNTCAYENDGECDVPNFCPEGTDLADCEDTCAYENDGVCDVPDYCPEGTDLADCETPDCEVSWPDPADCDAGTQDALWCSNAYGGLACAEGAELVVCDAGDWVIVSGAAADQYCQDYGFISYFGCEGTFGTTQPYCD
jgi:hypothetical protein